MVLDASAAVRLITFTGGAEIEKLFRERGRTFFVPALADVEVLSALRRFVLRGRMTRRLAHEALSDYRSLPLVRRSHEPLLERAFELRDNFSAYDAMYVALAQQIDATLVTADRRLARAARRHVGIEVVEA